MNSTAVSITVDGAVATVALTRPDKRNALNEEAILGIEAFFADPPPEVRVAVLQGEGEHFCAGLDLADHRVRTPFESMQHSRLWHRAFDRI